MRLYLFNLTNSIVFVKSGSECSTNGLELSILPNVSATLPSGKNKFILSSVGGDSSSTLEKEKVSPELEIERQYVVNPTKAFPSRWNLLAMPEDCPWRIYRDQVISLAPLSVSAKWMA